MNPWDILGWTLVCFVAVMAFGVTVFIVTITTAAIRRPKNTGTHIMGGKRE